MADVYTQNISALIAQLQAQLLTLSQAQQELFNTISETEANMTATNKDCQEIKSNMDKVAIYHTKLLSLKATMSMLSGRSRQLQERANKLKLMKLNYLSQVDHIRKLEQERDLSIAAKTSLSAPVSPGISPSTIDTTVDIPSKEDAASPAAATTPTTVTRKSISKTAPKSKKKTKARQVLLDDDDEVDKSSWIPKKSLSQKSLHSEK